jgi:hypothetical protein
VSEQRVHNRPRRRMKTLTLVAAAIIVLFLGGGAAAAQAYTTDNTEKPRPAAGSPVEPTGELGVPCCKQLAGESVEEEATVSSVPPPLPKDTSNLLHGGRLSRRNSVLVG